MSNHEANKWQRHVTTGPSRRIGAKSAIMPPRIVNDMKETCANRGGTEHAGSIQGGSGRRLEWCAHLRFLVDGCLSVDQGVHKEAYLSSCKNRTGDDQVDSPARVEVDRVAIDYRGTG